MNYIRTTCPCLHLDLTFKVVVFKLWLAESELTKHLIQAKLLTAATVTYKGWTAQKQPERQHNNQQRGRSRVRDAESTQKDRQSTRVSSYVEFNYRTDYTVVKILEIYDCVTRNTSLISSKMATIFLILILIFLTHISDKEEHSLWIKFSLLISLWKQIHNFNYVCVCVFVWSNIQEDGIAQQKLCNQWLLLDGFGCSWTNY